MSLELDRRLAEGVSPTNSHELSLRAHQLMRVRTRRALSGGLTDAVETAGRPRPLCTSAVPLVREGVLEAADALECLAHDLTTVADPSVRGVALASFLMCDGAASPLYNRRSPVTVLEIAQRARSALRRRAS
jgi:hypothetical protein